MEACGVNDLSIYHVHSKVEKVLYESHGTVLTWVSVDRDSPRKTRDLASSINKGSVREATPR